MPTPTTQPEAGYWAAFDDLNAWLTTHEPDAAAHLNAEWSLPEQRTAGDPRIDNGLRLNEVESIALTTALNDVVNGVAVSEQASRFCVLALARVTGRFDWLEDTP